MPKKDVALIIAGLRGGKREGHAEPDETGLQAAAEDILSAIKSEDARLLTQALKDFYYQVDLDEPEEKEESEY